MQPGAKKLLMLFLVLCFLGQTALVYTDGDTEVRLTGPALEGARAFHDHNCQVCHQVYGFGGFLGPDLTNVAARFKGQALHDRVAQVLRDGPGQMPAFDVTDDDVAALVAYLEALDRTGTGQLRIDAPGAGFTELVAARIGDADPAVRRGFEAFSARPCTGCHVPFRTSDVGAPDLTSVRDRLDAAALDAVLASGRLPRMPPPAPPLSEADRADVAAFLGWLADNRGDLQAASRAARKLDWTALPWWEYP